MVAERFVNLKRFLVTKIEDIKSVNVDMSSEKQCKKKHCRLLFQVSKERLNLFGQYKSVPKKITKVLING